MAKKRQSRASKKQVTRMATTREQLPLHGKGLSGQKNAPRFTANLRTTGWVEEAVDILMPAKQVKRNVREGNLVKEDTTLPAYRVHTKKTAVQKQGNTPDYFRPIVDLEDATVTIAKVFQDDVAAIMFTAIFEANGILENAIGTPANIWEGVLRHIKAHFKQVSQYSAQSDLSLEQLVELGFDAMADDRTSFTSHGVNAEHVVNVKERLESLPVNVMDATVSAMAGDTLTSRDYKALSAHAERQHKAQPKPYELLAMAILDDVNPSQLLDVDRTLPSKPLKQAQLDTLDQMIGAQPMTTPSMPTPSNVVVDAYSEITGKQVARHKTGKYTAETVLALDPAPERRERQPDPCEICAGTGYMRKYLNNSNVPVPAGIAQLPRCKADVHKARAQA